jgi:outer membrane receptor protein involved in Fe transport
VFGVACVRALAAQRPDTLPERRTQQDTVRREHGPALLAPLEIRASIVPTAGIDVGSGVPSRVTQIDQASLGAWHPRLLDQAITAAPGVSLYDDLGSPSKASITMRGFAAGPTVGLPSGIAVFLDGVRENEPDAQEVNFDLLPMAVVNRIEILNGPASLLGPNGLAGAINLITNRGSGPAHGTIDVEGGSCGARSLEVSSDAGDRNGWRYFTTLGLDRGEGWRAATSHSAGHAFGNFGRANAERGMNLQLAVATSRAQTAGSLPESIFDADPRVNFTAGDVDAIRLGQVALSAFTPLASGRATVTVYARQSHADRFNANQPPDDNVRDLSAATSEGGTVDWRRSTRLSSVSLDTRLGLDAAWDQVRIRLFDLPPTGATGADSLTTDVSSPRTSLAGYMLADAHFDRFTLSAGARYDLIHSPFDDRLDTSDVTTTQTFRRITPRGGLSVDLGHGASVYASTAASFRAPALLEIGCADPSATCPLPFALGNDPPLKPVTATSIEIGGQALVGNILLRASAFRMHVHDEIFFISSERALLGGYFANVPQTRRAGADIEIGQAGPGRLSWDASYAWNRATFDSSLPIFSIRSSPDFSQSPYAGDNHVAPGSSLPLVPRDEIKVGALLQLTTGFDLGLDARRTGQQWLRGDEANQTKPLDAYSVLNVRANLTRGAWRTGIVVRNLLDSHAAVFGGFNENRQTNGLERFLMPVDARSVQLRVERTIGPSAN